MNKISKLVFAVALLALAAGSAMATPVPNSAALFTRVFNDTPFSVLTTTNSYPSLIQIADESVAPAAWANLHTWRFSQDGLTSMEVMNQDGFAFSADVTISGANGEAGLNISPWWSPLVDGRFNIRTPDGEVAVFGGRLPFYSFTANYGKLYVAGTTVRLTMIYTPNSEMTLAQPATIEYIYDDGVAVSSGPLAFDEGNPFENPPHGVFGILNPATAGGYMQFNNMSGQVGQTMTTTWGNVSFQDLGTVVATEETSFGAVKALFR
jgi:hypothetical protein